MRDIGDRLARFFSGSPSAVAAVYLFGSTARGVGSSASDIDVAVLFDTQPPGTLDGAPLTLEGALERELGRRVDLVTLNSASADLVHRVLTDGVLVYERDRARRIRFEVARRSEYFDLEPIRQRYRRGRATNAPMP